MSGDRNGEAPSQRRVAARTRSASGPAAGSALSGSGCGDAHQWCLMYGVKFSRHASAPSSSSNPPPLPPTTATFAASPSSLPAADLQGGQPTVGVTSNESRLKSGQRTILARVGTRIECKGAGGGCYAAGGDGWNGLAQESKSPAFEWRSAPCALRRHLAALAKSARGRGCGTGSSGKTVVARR